MSKKFGPFRPGEQDAPKPTDAGRTPKRRIIYAAGHMDMLGNGSADDPMSSSFIPLEERSPIERARLFARRKRVAPKIVEFD